MYVVVGSINFARCSKIQTLSFVCHQVHFASELLSNLFFSFFHPIMMPLDFFPISPICFIWCSQRLWALLFSLFAWISSFFELILFKLNHKFPLIPKITFMNSDPSYSKLTNQNQTSHPFLLIANFLGNLKLPGSSPAALLDFWTGFNRECWSLEMLPPVFS